MNAIERLSQLEKESVHLHIPILGREKGAWLAAFVLENKPKTVLELGTANGYSGTILASSGAHLTTIDIDVRAQEWAKKTFSQFGFSADLITGDAVQAVKKLVAQKKKFDLIFIDFEKKKYIDVLEDCILLCRKNGFIIADNITMTKCAPYKKAVLSHPQLSTTLIDIKDGLSVSKVMD